MNTLRLLLGSALLLTSITYAQTGTYQIDGNLDVTGDATVDGKLGVGEENPEQALHVKRPAYTKILVEASDGAVPYWNAAEIQLKAPTNVPDTGIFAIMNTTTPDSGDGLRHTLFAIHKKDLLGAYKGTIIDYTTKLDLWIIYSGGTSALKIGPTAVASEKLLEARNGLTVTNGLTTDSLTIGGVTYAENSILQVGADSSVDLTGNNFFNAGQSSYSIAWGAGNYIGEVNGALLSTAWGASNYVDGFNSTVWGHSNAINANQSTVWGRGNISNSYQNTVFGQYALHDVSHNKSTWIPTEPLLLVGNGTDDANRSNALELLKNGNMTVSGTLKASKGVVLDNGAEATAGAIRYNGTDFEGYNGTAWVSLTEPPDTVNGDISMGNFQ